MADQHNGLMAVIDVLNKEHGVTEQDLIQETKRKFEYETS